MAVTAVAATGWLVQDVAPAAAAPAAINVCNGTDNVGGQAVECEVTVVNTLNVATGAASSTVTVRECHGAANTPLPCTTTVTPFADITASVTQCNGSGSGGGGTVRCTVNVTNNITGAFPSAAVTVNQCIGSATDGAQPGSLCSPPGAAPSATVTQCNSSGNGGGAALRVQCTVALSSTQTSALPVTINQCNGSGNGGGAFVTCTSSIRNIALAGPAPAPAPAPTPTLTPSATPSPTLTPSAAPSPTLTPSAAPSPTLTPSAAPSPTLTPSATPSPNLTPSAAPSPIASPSATTTPSSSPIVSPVSANPSVAPTAPVAAPVQPAPVPVAAPVAPPAPEAVPVDVAAAGTSLPRTGSPVGSELLYGVICVLLGIALYFGVPVPGRGERRVWFLDYVA